MGITMNRALNFVFQFPPIQGVFDTGYGVVYIFGELHESGIEDIIVHETLHFVLLKVAGKKASLKLDNIHALVSDEV
jgi:hypothetical protein